MAQPQSSSGGHRHHAHSSESDGRSSTSSTLTRRNVRQPAYAFILPNLEQFPDDFRRFLEKEMIEIHTLKRLEASGHLNWWCLQNPSQRLYPLVTTGDGNCLLHAASLGIWGVHDRQLNLRQLLHEVLTTGERRNAFYRRWRWHESQSNLQSELVLSEEEWEKEWKGVLELAAPTPRVNLDAGTGSNDQIYESLECIHVFALAQVLRRPIIVVSDTVLRNANGEELAPIPFGGIYLPLEFRAEHCHRSPLVLCYDASHFSSLVAMRQTTSNYLQAIPITDRSRNLLPIHFSIDPGPDFTWWRDAKDHQLTMELETHQTDERHLELIGTYMDIVKMDLRRGSVKKTMPVVHGTEPTPSVPLKLLTLAAGRNDRGRGGNRILNEIRQHFKWLTRKSKRKLSRPTFSASELRQSNCVLTVLLHNYAHQYMDSMVNNYIVGVRERFEHFKQVPSCTSVPKNRMSRSFSSSSVLLTCLNPHCNKSASPSTNFLCSACFEDQKREMASLGSSSVSPHSSTGNSSFDQSHPDSAYCSKSSTMPALSEHSDTPRIAVRDFLAEESDHIPSTLTPTSATTRKLSSTVSSSNADEDQSSAYYTPLEGRSYNTTSRRSQLSADRPNSFNSTDRYKSLGNPSDSYDNYNSLSNSMARVSVRDRQARARPTQLTDRPAHSHQPSAPVEIRSLPRVRESGAYSADRVYSQSYGSDRHAMPRTYDPSCREGYGRQFSERRYRDNSYGHDPRGRVGVLDAHDRTPHFSPVQRFLLNSPSTPVAPIMASGRSISESNDVLTRKSPSGAVSHYYYAAS